MLGHNKEFNNIKAKVKSSKKQRLKFVNEVIEKAERLEAEAA